jgi:Flp pilus assembly protein TadG
MRGLKRSNQRGQAAIEGALVLMVLLATVIAILDFGQMMFLHQTLTERARAAARHAGLHPDQTDQARNLVLYGSTTAPVGAPAGFWGLTPAQVNIARINQDSNEDSMVVTISGYQFKFFSLWISGSHRGKPIVASSPVET